MSFYFLTALTGCMYGGSHIWPSFPKYRVKCKKIYNQFLSYAEKQMKVNLDNEMILFYVWVRERERERKRVREKEGERERGWERKRVREKERTGERVRAREIEC